MAYFAVPESNVIINVIVADNKEIADTVTGKDCFQYTREKPLSIGMILNQQTKKWEYPEPLD